MAASKNKKKGGRKQQPAPQQKQKRMSVPRSGLDSYALAYAKLLSDPCSAPLVSPVYSGSDGGLLIRAESTYTIATAGALEGLFVWTPGGIGNNSGVASSISTGWATVVGTPFSLAGTVAAVQPGQLYLGPNAAEARVVSACMQIFYTGTEVNRGGLIAYGNLVGGTFLQGTTVTAAASMNSFEHYARTPDSVIEVKFRPTNFDQNYTVPANQTSQTELSRRAALGFAFVGLPATASLQVRLVAVYEYLPAYGIGLTNNTRTRSWSSNTLEQVTNFLDKMGDWTVKGSHVATSLAQAYAAGNIMRQVGYSGRIGRPQLMY
jgi:hypothetical protein